ncbi:MAG: bifunctional UDP-N-acetylmuramoyl-tripeptide:D-alanyl-D-alanine ligase/alanine racemase [Bacteroidota bacterium]
MNYTVSNIALIINAKILQQNNDAVIDNILTDSRRIAFASGALFFAIKGPRRNGNTFIAELYQKEVRNFIVDDSFDLIDLYLFPEASFLLVDDVLIALQVFVANHRNQFQLPVIGITGSNGKTIIKEWLFQLLNHSFDIVRSPKSYNSQIGVPLSVWQINENHNLGIFEAGISMPGEMEKLQKIIRPNIGILSFIGDAHAEGFINAEQKINEKLKLFSDADLLIYCNENEAVNNGIQSFLKNENKSLRLFSWSRTSTADLQITKIDKQASASYLSCNYKDISFVFSIPFTDEASIFNAITCCATMLNLGMEISFMVNAINELRPVAMRLELKQGINQCVVINDSYSADIDSLNIALDFLAQQEFYSRKTIILSDMLQSDLSDELLYQKMASLIKQKKISRIIGIGPNISANAHSFEWLPEKHFFATTQEFIDAIPSINFNNEAILIKGARIFEFEKIGQIIEQKLHDTILEINLNALRNNLKTYRHQLHKNTKLMAMVKAFSYGSGSVEIANLLQQEGVEYLAVAYTDEGVELRKGGIRLPIMVMNTTEVGFDNLILYQLEPEIYSFTIFDAFKKYLAHKKINQFPVHIKLDTGMHRLGFMSHEIDDLCNQLKDEKLFTIKSVFSHLVASEDSAQETFTVQQGIDFEFMANKIASTVGYTFLKHLANTSAIHFYPRMQFDMVRLGIGIYGVDENFALENVTTLKTTIAQIKKIKKGDTVGYGRKGLTAHDSLIATVRIGYADGYSRAFGNGNGKMLVNGQMAPVIGNVCMDMTMLDITGVDANEGDEVIVFGEQLPVKKIAQWANTIPYEILTNISQRVKRVYFEE